MNLLNTRSNELPGVKRNSKTQNHAGVGRLVPRRGNGEMGDGGDGPR